MKKKILIEGMSCKHCVKHVEDALKEIEGIISVKVDLKNKNATVDLANEINDERIRSAIEDAGYEVTGIETL